MHGQPDSLFIKPDDSACIVQCSCGMGQYHGQLEFYIDPDIDKVEDAWIDATHCYVCVAMPPVEGYWSGWLSRFWRLSTICRRIAVALSILRGKRLEYDFNIGAQTVGDLGEWFARAKAKADAVLATKPGPTMTLAELRAKLKETDYFWDAVRAIINSDPWSLSLTDVIRITQGLLAGTTRVPRHGQMLTLDAYIQQRAEEETPITRAEVLGQ
jgi:hypothetical protein